MIFWVFWGGVSPSPLGILSLLEQNQPHGCLSRSWESRCRRLSCHECVFRCVLRLFEGLIPHPWLTIAMCAPLSRRSSSTGSSSQLHFELTKACPFFAAQQNTLTIPTVLFSFNLFLSWWQYSHCYNWSCNIRAAVSPREKGVCALYLLTPWSPNEREHGRWQGSSVWFPHLLQNGALLLHCLFNEQGTIQEWGCVCVQWAPLRFLSLFCCFQNQRFFLAVIFSTCGLSFWARAACIWGLQRKPGQGHCCCGSDP